jgi:hypothetical protein
VTCHKAAAAVKRVTWKLIFCLLSFWSLSICRAIRQLNILRTSVWHVNQKCVHLCLLFRDGRAAESTQKVEHNDFKLELFKKMANNDSAMSRFISGDEGTFNLIE